MSSPLSPAEITSMAKAHTGHFGMTCRIERFTSGGVDADNHPTGTWGVTYEGACHYVEREEHEVSTNVNAIVGGSVLQLPRASAVTPGDRVAWIKDTVGTQIVGAVDIESVLEREDGLDLVLQEVA